MRETWKSKLGFILAAVGSAIGLGNIWRYNYLAAKNGGSAFLIPYLIALFAAGIPILILEFALGHKMRGSAPLAFSKIKNNDGQRFEWLGWFGTTVAMFGIMLYYCVVIAWTLNFFFASFNMSWDKVDIKKHVNEQINYYQKQKDKITKEIEAIKLRVQEIEAKITSNNVKDKSKVDKELKDSINKLNTLTNKLELLTKKIKAINIPISKQKVAQKKGEYYFFREVLGLKEGVDFWHPGSLQLWIVIALAVVWFINWYISWRGVQNGIELANKIFMPLLFILTTILVINGIFLKGAGIGLTKYFKPDFSKIGDVSIWIAAFSQIFFTLSLSFGIMIVYGSYVPEDGLRTKDAFITAFLNSGFSIFAGIAVFSIMGNFAHTTGLSIDEVISGGPGLAFIMFPAAITKLPFGDAIKIIFGALFFLSLLIAGISSSISLLEAFTASLVDKFGFNRKKTITLLSILGFLGGLIFTTKGGILWLDLVDNFLTNYGLVIVGVLECLIIGWIYGVKELKRHMHYVSGKHIGRWWDISIKYVSPLILLVIIGTKVVEEVRSPYGGYGRLASFLVGFMWLFIGGIVAYIFTKKKWKNNINI